MAMVGSVFICPALSLGPFGQDSLIGGTIMAPPIHAPVIRFKIRVIFPKEIPAANWDKSLIEGSFE